MPLSGKVHYILKICGKRMFSVSKIIRTADRNRGGGINGQCALETIEIITQVRRAHRVGKLVIQIFLRQIFF